MPRSVCDWDRWGSKWRERKGGEWRATAAWEHCLEESLGRLFPVVCLIRYSGVLSHYKTCRRNLFWLFCAHRNKENHPGSEWNKNNILKALNTKCHKAREGNSTSKRCHPESKGSISPAGDAVPWVYSSTREQNLNSAIKPGIRGEQKCFWVSIALKSWKKQHKSSLEESLLK